MNITEYLVIQKRIPKYRDDKPYRLFITGYGPVGDKFNVDTNEAHSAFPVDASGSFQTKAEAIECYWKFLGYVRSKIADKNKPLSDSTDLEINNKKKTNPSYYHWQ